MVARGDFVYLNKQAIIRGHMSEINLVCVRHEKISGNFLKVIPIVTESQSQCFYNHVVILFRDVRISIKNDSKGKIQIIMELSGIIGDVVVVNFQLWMLWNNKMWNSVDRKLDSKGEKEVSLIHWGVLQLSPAG